jgi:hypothetical protein
MYKIGDYIKIKREFVIKPWFYSKMIRIIDIDNCVLRLNVNLLDDDGNYDPKGNFIHKEHVYQDEQCKRKLKLERVLQCK